MLTGWRHAHRTRHQGLDLGAGPPLPGLRVRRPRLERERVPQAIRDNATLWEVVLGTDDAAVRPSPVVWSPLEYACHVRDVNELFEQRLGLMLTEDDPQFANWDQDEAAIERRLPRAGPRDGGARGGRGRRARGRPLRDGARRPVGADRHAQQRRPLHRRHVRSLPPPRPRAPRPRRLPHHQARDRGVLRGLRRRVRRRHPGDARQRPGRDRRASRASSAEGARVLEVGSGHGRDALALEAAGLSVRRTDITPAFVRMLRADGPRRRRRRPPDRRPHRPRGPRRRTTACGPPRRCSTSGARTCRRCWPTWPRATRPDGLLMLGLKEGDGARFSTHGHVGGAAALHVLARGAAAGRARRGGLGRDRGRRTTRACAATRGWSWRARRGR